MAALEGSNTIALLSSDNGAPDSYQHKQPGQPLDAITGSNALFLGGKTQARPPKTQINIPARLFVRAGVLTLSSGRRLTDLGRRAARARAGVVAGRRRAAAALRGRVDARRLRNRRRGHQRADADRPDLRLGEKTSPRSPMSPSHFCSVLSAPADSWKNGSFQVSLLPLVTGKTTTPPRTASFFYAGATLMAVRVGEFKAHLVTVQPEEVSFQLRPTSCPSTSSS